MLLMRYTGRHAWSICLVPKSASIAPIILPNLHSREKDARRQMIELGVSPLTAVEIGESTMFVCESPYHVPGEE